MTGLCFHPSMIQLLRLQSRGRLRRMTHRFRQPRRLFLSALACILAVVWLGNAAMTIWLRETASPPTLRAMLTLGLLLYAAWHVVKAAFFRPQTPFDWTAAERETLAAMPLRPSDLVAYQLASVTLTTLVKSGLFTLLLLPDLSCLPLGCLGVVSAMLFLEMLRLTIEIATWGMSRGAFLTCRAVIVACLSAAGIAAAAMIQQQLHLDHVSLAEQGVFQPLLDILNRLHASAPVIAMPFEPFVDLILADRITLANALLAAALSAVVAALAAGVVTLYGMASRGMANREKRNYDPGVVHVRPDSRADLHDPTSMRLVPSWGGVGPLVWRQLIGAGRHWGSLLTAMIAPAVLASAPCFAIANADFAFLATAGTLAFYTFLLLPTALRFDFRRDLDRLAALKTLPISPVATAIGQILAPVLIATLFQAAVLAFAIAARSLSPQHLLTAMLVMIPMNVLVFGFDNLIFLLYPYRVQQEGLEIFLRTLLSFTGKGVAFTLGLVLLTAWGFTAAALSRTAPATTIGLEAPVLFAAGIIGGVTGLATLVLYGLYRTYDNLDLIEDLPR